jgi:hypothetical protein
MVEDQLGSTDGWEVGTVMTSADVRAGDPRARLIMLCGTAGIRRYIQRRQDTQCLDEGENSCWRRIC